MNTRYSALALVAALAVLEGCNPAPHYTKPPVQTPPSFKEAVPAEFKENDGWRIAQPSDDKIRGKWWEMYHDPQLNALEEQVQVSNQSILAAEANYRSARALVVSARSALFPTISASPSYTNSRFSQTSRIATGSFGSASTTTGSSFGNTGSTGTTSGSGTTTTTGTTSGGGSGSAAGSIINEFSLPFQATYVVDFWHKVRNTIAANAYQAQASAGDVATALLSTQAELAQDYFEVRALDAERAVLQDTVEHYRQTRDLTRSLFNSGIDSEQDLSLAQTQLDSAMVQATDLGVSRAQYEHAIAVLIGKPPAEFSLPVGEFVARPPDVPLAVPSELLQRRPDIAANERRVAAANAQIGVARAAYYPSLTLSANGGFETSQIQNWFIWPSRFWSLGPTLAQTLFDAGARRAQTEQAQAAYDSAVANYRQTVLTVFQNVEDNLSALRILSEEVGQAHTAVGSATHTLDLSLARFKGGVDSYLNVVTAQTGVLTNRETEVQIQLRQMTASVALIMALGGGWDASELPQMKELLAKPAKWTPNAPAPGPNPAALAAPNPPPVSPRAAPARD
jgi:NodT family efflux transporter outer membrane factor (OMF) lipoprotein